MTARKAATNGKVQTRRLRVAQATINLTLMWDDGEDLTPGPQINPISLALAGIPEWLEGLPAELEEFEKQQPPLDKL